MSIGSNIERLLEANGMNQDDLAKALKVSPATVSYWVSDQKVPRMGKIERMAAIFNVLKSEIIDDSTGGTTAAFRLLESLSDEKRQEAERYIRYLAREDSPGNPK